MKDQHSIIGINKLNDNLKITQMVEHNLRLKVHKNIDKTRSHNNECLINNLGTIKRAKDFTKNLKEKYEKLGIKEKSNNVLAVEFVLTASPEFWFGDIQGFDLKTWNDLSMTNDDDRKIINSFWNQMDKNKLEQWKKVQIEFAKEQYGDSIERIDLHLDEKSPHCHVIINTAIKSEKKYKNQKGEFFKTTWSLNAARFGPEYLIEMHDRYALKMQPFGLKRGKRRSETIEGYRVKHKTLKEHYAEKEFSTSKIMENDLNLLEREKKIKGMMTQIKAHINEQSKTIMNLLDILEKKDLTDEESEYLAEITGKNKNISKKI